MVTVYCGHGHIAIKQFQLIARFTARTCGQPSQVLEYTDSYSDYCAVFIEIGTHVQALNAKSVNTNA